MRALAVIAALVVTWGTEARASQCAPPFPIVLPHKTVPEDGVLFVFVPTRGDWYEPEHLDAAAQKLLSELWVEASNGAALPFRLSRIHHQPGLDVFALRVNAKAGVEFVVRPVTPSFAVTVAKREKVTPLRLELTAGSEDNFRDGLSRESTRVLVPSIDAPAYRVTWRGGSTVLSGREALDPWSHGRAPRELRLGARYCSEPSVQWLVPTEFTITALLSDGREVTAAPLTLEPPPPYESLPTR